MSFARVLAASAAACLAACAAATPPAAAAAPISAADAAAAFVELLGMVGTWRPADAPDSSLRIRFYLTAGGTVLVESWERGGKPHSLTLYHRDGPALLASHYCPQGNQPRLALAAGSGPLHFAFQDATDLDAATESHQHDLWFDLADPQRPLRGEAYRAPGRLEPREDMRLVRAD